MYIISDISIFSQNRSRGIECNRYIFMLQFLANTILCKNVYCISPLLNYVNKYGIIIIIVILLVTSSFPNHRQKILEVRFMLKIVRYNGGELSYYGCTGNPKNLVVGKLYKVVSEDVRAWQTDYTLHGLTGEYNSVWFDTVLEMKAPAIIAKSHNIPIVGQRYSCSKVIDGKLNGVLTSPVKAVKRLGFNLYLTKTRNSVYVVQVG